MCFCSSFILDPKGRLLIPWVGGCCAHFCPVPCCQLSGIYRKMISRFFLLLSNTSWNRNEEGLFLELERKHDGTVPLSYCKKTHFRCGMCGHNLTWWPFCAFAYNSIIFSSTPSINYITNTGIVSSGLLQEPFEVPAWIQWTTLLGERSHCSARRKWKALEWSRTEQSCPGQERPTQDWHLMCMLFPCST